MHILGTYNGRHRHPNRRGRWENRLAGWCREQYGLGPGFAVSAVLLAFKALREEVRT